MFCRPKYVGFWIRFRIRAIEPDISGKQSEATDANHLSSNSPVLKKNVSKVYKTYFSNNDLENLRTMISGLWKIREIFATAISSTLLLFSACFVISEQNRTLGRSRLVK